jgi:hypothetical protein
LPIDHQAIQAEVDQAGQMIEQVLSAAESVAETG